jgi:hypothetical protein
VAALGIIGVLVGGYALSGGGSAAEPPVMMMVPVGMAPELTGDSEWASRAQTALASIGEQVVALDEAEDAWSAAAADPDEAPPAVVELRQRRDLIEQRQTTLQSQLTTYSDMLRLREELHTTQASLRSVEDALAKAPAENAQVVALRDQRDLHERRLTAGRDQVIGLEESVRSAIQAPPPDDAELTDRVRERVLVEVRAAGGDVPGTADTTARAGTAVDDTDPHGPGPGAGSGG